jgi:hypothetical protein
MKNKMTTTKGLALSLVSLSIGLATSTVHANPTAAVTCDGTELNTDGKFNVNRFLYLKGYGSSHPKPQELKRTIKLDAFFAIPRPDEPSGRSNFIVKGLTEALIFHAAAAKFGLPGVTKGLVNSNSKNAGKSLAEQRAMRSAEGVKVSLRGENSSTLTCRRAPSNSGGFNQGGYYTSPASYLRVTNGEIGDPRSWVTYSCNLNGRWEDLGPSLYTVLKENFRAKATDSIVFEQEVNDSKSAPGSLERNEAFLTASSAFWSRIKSKAEFFEPLSSFQDVRRMDMKNAWPVNQVIFDERGGTRETLTPIETLNAKAFAIHDPCDATLTCTKSSCQLLSWDEFRAIEPSLSVVE